MTQTLAPPVFHESPAHVSLPGSPGPGIGVEAPRALAGLRVVGVDEAANAVLAAGDADDHLVLDDQRRDRRGVADLVVLERRVPDDGAGLHVEREQVRVERGHEQLVAEHAEAAVDEAAAGGQVRRQLAAVAPDLAAGPRVDRPRDVLRAGDVEHVVAQSGVVSKLPSVAGLERPLRDEPVDVGRRDLRQRAVPLIGVVAAEGQPARAVGGQAVEDLLDRHQRAAAPAGPISDGRSEHEQTAKTWRMRIRPPPTTA